MQESYRILLALPPQAAGTSDHEWSSLKERISPISLLYTLAHPSQVLIVNSSYPHASCICGYIHSLFQILASSIRLPSRFLQAS